MSQLLRFVGCATAFLVLTTASSLAWAQETNPPGAVEPVPPAVTPSEPSTDNPATALPTPPDNRPAPTPPVLPSLSLQPAPASPPSEPSTNVIDTNPESFNFVNPASQAEDLANHLLVVYNQDDFNSRSLAHYYASQRNIPDDHVFPITCSLDEEITRAEFEKTIREPILYYLLQKNWMVRQNVETHLGTRTINLLVATRNDIWAIVLVRGVPLKVAPDPTDDDAMEHEPALQTNAASVDSELALLPIFGFPHGGFVPNLFFDPKASRLHRVGPELAKNMILVSRLDGPTPAQVRRMIDDSLYAEKNRLAGLAVIDTRNITDVKSGYFSGDAWLRNSRNLLLQAGWPVKFDDKPEVLPATDPCNQVALYLGWYSGQAEGPWVTSPDRFVRGAVAYHLHSFSANTIRSETSNWVGPLIAHGADATMGCVYEPYLALTPHEDVFTKRLLDGDYFAEAAYASIPGLSWMVTVVGDPLYRPFRVPLEDAIAAAGTPRTDHDDWLLLQQIRRGIVTGQVQPTTDGLQQSLNVSGAGPVAEEGLGDLLVMIRDPHPGYSVDQAYKKAQAAYTLPIDRIRVGFKLAQYYSNHGQDNRAQAQLDILRQEFPVDSARFGLAGPLVPTSATPLPPRQAAPSYERNNSDWAAPTPPRPPGPPAPQPAPNGP